jgi:hypothetical protein
MGNHLLEFQALNTNGLRMVVPASAVVAVSGATSGVGGSDGSVFSAPPAVTAAPNPSPGAVRFTLRGPAGSPAVAQVFDVAGRLVRSWDFVVPQHGQIEWVWDGRGPRGGQPAGGIYFLVARVGADRLARRIVLLR